MSEKFTFEWIKRGDRPINPPNPDYPNGIEVNMRLRPGPVCHIDLPYPAKEVGTHIITCNECGRRVAITAASRADDPRVLVVTCKKTLQ